MPTTRKLDRSGRLDVSGRPLGLRDVDLDTFLHPKTIALIGASEQSAKPNTAMTRKFDAWARQNGAAFYPVHPTYETVLGHRCFKSVFDIPGELDLAIILTGRAVDTFEEVLQRKAKFAVIFAAGFSETGAEGKKTRGAARPPGAGGRRAPARPEHEPQRVRGIPPGPRRPVDRLDHAVRASGPSGVPGPGDRYPAHALGADRQRGRPRIRRLRRATSPTGPKSA